LEIDKEQETLLKQQQEQQPQGEHGSRHGASTVKMMESIISIMEGNMDLDKVLSYNTKQQVNILDRTLGITANILTLAVVGYIIVGIFVVNEGYLEFESSKGAIATHVRGDAFAVSSGREAERYFSAEELTLPGLENGNVFVSTRQKIYHQERGICEDHTLPCEKDEHCSVLPGSTTEPVRGRCTENKFCEEPAWCNKHELPEIYDLNVADFNIWVKASIQFINLAPTTIYATENEHPFPQEGYNVFNVRDLLLQCTPVPVRYEEISKLGAAIEVQIFWKCDVGDKECTPILRARRMDPLLDKNNIGYSWGYPEYLNDDERMLYEMTGVRIFFRSVGMGEMVSMAAIILKASTSSCLLGLAPIVADLLMLNAFALKKKFRARKYDVSEDFSEYFERLEERKKADSEATMARFLEDDDNETKEQEWQEKVDMDKM